MSNIPIVKTVFEKNQFINVVDTSFSQLVKQDVGDEEPIFTLDDFFEMYESLFNQIPKEGDTNSHQYILEKEANYLGVQISQDDIQALLEEITNLRQELLDTQIENIDLLKLTKNK